MEFKVSSPTQFNKFQHGGRVLTFEPQDIIKLWLIIMNFLF